MMMMMMIMIMKPQLYVAKLTVLLHFL